MSFTAVSSSKQLSMSIQNPPTSFGVKVKKTVFLVGSYLTEPFCKSHELYRRISIVEALHPKASKVANLGRKFFLLLCAFGFGVIGLLTTLPGIILRGVAASIEEKPFIEVKGKSAPKTLPEDRQLSLLSWNVCCVGAGYPITDGGVTPRKFRYKEIISKIVSTNADVNCLYEVFDVVTGEYFKKELEKKGYTHFYYNIGPRAIGVSSALFVASKYEIGDPEFTAFPKNTLVGRTKNSEKGVFAFSVLDNKNPVVRILSTHPQHSEEPDFPSDAEITGREKQMQIIKKIADKIIDMPIIITGDFNMDDPELNALNCFQDFDPGDLELDKKTWGGDSWCAQLVNKRESNGENLDHILGNRVNLVTKFAFDTGYDDKKFKINAISDHEPLLATFSV